MWNLYILKQGWEDSDAPFCWDDIENGDVSVCPECEYQASDSEEFARDDHGDMIYPPKCPECHSILDGYPDSELQEVYEWWICSGWLIDKLKAKGEPVLESECIWGRCTTGQGILLDEVISEICEDMGILEGQENEWQV